MAKEDFCFTYYDGDAARDKAHMNRLERGAYDDIISAQRKRGHLSIDDIKKVLGSDFDTCWSSMEWVLIKDEAGKFFIEWVDKSLEKMRRQSEKQKENVAKRWNKDTNDIPTEYHGTSLVMPLVNENGNEDVIGIKEKGVQGEKRFNTMPLPADAGDLPDIKINSCIELLKITKQVTVEFTQVQKLWPVFLAQNVNGTKYYANVEAIHSHFINWIKTQKFESATKLTGTPRQNGQALARQRLREQGAALFNAAAREADNRA